MPHRATLAATLAAMLFAGSMAVYPGGTVWNPHSQGYDLLRNYLCDLLAPHALNGAHNPWGAAMGIAAFMVIIAAHLVPLWWTLPTRLPHYRWPVHVRRFGLGSLALFMMMPLALWTNAHLVHHVVVFGAGSMGFGAALVMAIQLGRGALIPTWVTAVGLAGLIVSVVDTIIYAVQLTAHHEPAVVGPTLQKVALALILVWLPGVATHLKGD